MSYATALKPLLILGLFLIAISVALASQNSAMTKTQLAPCPDSPNCIVTEYPQVVKRHIEPIAFSEVAIKTKDVATLMQQIQSVIDKMGGTIVQQSKDYIQAEFKTKVFQFVDDFEIRIDQQKQLIHMRSASRSGYFDFGKNKNRIKEFSQLIMTNKEP